MKAPHVTVQSGACTPGPTCVEPPSRSPSHGGWSLEFKQLVDVFSPADHLLCGLRLMFGGCADLGSNVLHGHVESSQEYVIIITKGI